MKKGLVILGLALVMTFSSAWATDYQAMVYVMHGIPGIDLGLDLDLPVDISVNGACAITDFKFKDYVGPIMLGPGEYDIGIHLANLTAPCSEAAVLEATVPIHPGETCTIIAHLTDEGGITASKFTHDVSPISDESRIVIHHCANAPAVDFLGERLFGLKNPMVWVSDVSNGDKFMLELKQKGWLFKLYPAFADVVVTQKLFNLRIFEGMYVFAVGSLANNTFDWIWIRIGGLR
jgi:hypothetical protein